MTSWRVALCADYLFRTDPNSDQWTSCIAANANDAIQQCILAGCITQGTDGYGNDGNGSKSGKEALMLDMGLLANVRPQASSSLHQRSFRLAAYFSTAWRTTTPQPPRRFGLIGLSMARPTL